MLGHPAYIRTVKFCHVQSMRIMYILWAYPDICSNIGHAQSPRKKNKWMIQLHDTKESSPPYMCTSKQNKIPPWSNASSFPYSTNSMEEKRLYNVHVSPQPVEQLCVEQPWSSVLRVLAVHVHLKHDTLPQLLGSTAALTPRGEDWWIPDLF